MRLEKIKLSGFKSFVDATTVAFPDQLVGIVGPNGCGKSNVIDAVRWVMGESSAKYLRGESLADVIFNGSTSRKPIGRAAVELIFDNSSGKLGGQYANYSEIALKREVQRDGQSTYFLNGSRCRRRDIMDVFLGTGLSPRSYAIIEQGMINRLIEAKPQELRAYLEDAAGISKYKERRRETEHCIRHTQENLARVNDIIHELDKQLERLKRQSRSAERYKALKQEERELKGQLLAINHQQLSETITAQQQQLTVEEIALESALAESQTVETQLIKQRETHNELVEQQGGRQKTFYQLGSEISRLQQQIEYHQSRRKALEAEWQQTGELLDRAKWEMDQDQQQISTLSKELAQLPDLEQATALAQQSAEQLHEAEQSLQLWQQRWDEFTTTAADASKCVDVEKTRMSHLEQRQQEVNAQLSQQQQEYDQSAAQQQQLLAQQSDWQQDLAQAQASLTAEQTQLTEQQQQIQQQRRHNQQLHSELAALRDQLQQERGRLASLEALKEEALNKQGASADWLTQQGIAEQPRLLEQLQVEPGWERAVETVLGHHLEAVCVDELSPFCQATRQLNEGSVVLFAATDDVAAATPTADNSQLCDKVTADISLTPLLQGIYTAEDVDDALRQLSQLQTGESVVTREGVWLGHRWLRVVRSGDPHAGAIVREKALRKLAAAIYQLVEQVNAHDDELTAGETQLQQLEAARVETQQCVNSANQQVAAARATDQVGSDKLQRLLQRLEELKKAGQRLLTQQTTLTEQLQQTQTALQQASESMAQDSDLREQLQQQREVIQQQLLTARQQETEDRNARHQLELNSQQLRSQIESLQQAFQRGDKQYQNLHERRQQIEEEKQNALAPVAELQTTLDEQLNCHVEQEEQLAQLKQTLSESEHQLQQQEQMRKSAEQTVNSKREAIQQLQLNTQEWTVRRTTVDEQLVEGGYELATLLEHIANENYQQSDLTEQLEKVVNRLSRLGAINLAAIDELKQESERKAYLDSQAADLNEALATLEQAIRTIDQETRSRFRDTFEKANSAFQQLFPRIFGGGKASLQLTEDNLLEAGVIVMASPPGKRNSTIHLLSGGEKALTAIALVFSLFELNPAPFCMLDEVDAPLDDANIVRYCRLLQEMAERVQLIFITHNKITMEVASQLTGVTMQEAGVSRIVAVDVEEAAAMAEA
ncbi:MAG: chromosome segregation protein SMC [Gammaproteobacteria bacterium]|nr:chromosome segregation protein SMC [Gammaproteobacteria bacterium]